MQYLNSETRDHDISVVDLVVYVAKIPVEVNHEEVFNDVLGNALRCLVEAGLLSKALAAFRAEGRPVCVKVRLKALVPSKASKPWSRINGQRYKAFFYLSWKRATKGALSSC